MVQITALQRQQPRLRGTSTPSLQELRAWLATLPAWPRTVPIYREVVADLETPVSAFLKIRNGGSA
ncbi:MAG: hypothetical protein C4345_11100, partial [Chloroflexota bacterium]